MIQDFHFKEFIFILKRPCKPREKHEGVFFKRGFEEFRENVDKLIFCIKKDTLSVRVSKRADFLFNQAWRNEHPRRGSCTVFDIGKNINYRLNDNMLLVSIKRIILGAESESFDETAKSIELFKLFG